MLSLVSFCWCQDKIIKLLSNDSPAGQVSGVGVVDIGGGVGFSDGFWIWKKIKISKITQN